MATAKRCEQMALHLYTSLYIDHLLRYTSYSLSSCDYALYVYLQNTLLLSFIYI